MDQQKLKRANDIVQTMNQLKLDIIELKAANTVTFGCHKKPGKSHSFFINEKNNQALMEDFERLKRVTIGNFEDALQKLESEFSSL